MRQIGAKMIFYACLDCISVAHLHEIMQQSKIPIDIAYDNKGHSSGKCKKKKKSNVVSVIFHLSDDDDHHRKSMKVQLWQFT